jgi:hypothetical protein
MAETEKWPLHELHTIGQADARSLERGRDKDGDAWLAMVLGACAVRAQVPMRQEDFLAARDHTDW